MSRFDPKPATFVAGLALLAGGFSACSTVSAPKLSYEGERRPVRANVGPLLRVDAVGAGDEILGQVMASCTRECPNGGHFRVILGSLDCSAARLYQLIEEQALEVGGSALHRTLCNRMGERFECSANVVARGQRTTSSVFHATKRAVAGAQIDVDLAPGIELGDPWPEATEVAYLSVSERRIGTVRATVESPGTIDDARTSLFEAAALLGADHVVAPVCTDERRTAARSCLAVMAAPRLDSCNPVGGHTEP